MGEGEEPLPVEIPLWNGNQRDGVLVGGRGGKHLPGLSNQMAMWCNAQETQIRWHIQGAMEGPDLVGWQVEKTVQILRGHDGRFDFPLNGPFGIKNVDLGLVNFINRGRAIVHLKQDVRACRHRPSHSGRVLQRHGPGHPRPKEVALRIEAKPSKTLVSRVGVGSIELHGRPGHVEAQDGMMGDLVVARPHFHAPDRQVVVAFCGQPQTLGIVLSCRRHGGKVQAWPKPDRAPPIWLPDGK